MTAANACPIVLVTGADGNQGRSFAKALADGYRIVGLDRQAREMGKGPDDSYPILAVDLRSDESVFSALQAFRSAYGSRIASVVHLAAYFDFTGEDNPMYQSVNVDGTPRLLRALQGLEVGQFLYPSTMLVHAPCRPGERIDETQPLAPGWAKSKAAAEAVLREEHGHIPSVVLRLAGVYDTQTMVPTMAQQMARIYERDLQSHLYAGSLLELYRRISDSCCRRQQAGLPGGGGQVCRALEGVRRHPRRGVLERCAARWQGHQLQARREVRGRRSRRLCLGRVAIQSSATPATRSS